MGILISCCRRNKGKGQNRKPSEREPLLGQKQQRSNDLLPPPNNAFDKFVDVYAAIKAGKLPTQDQITQMAQLCLKSDLLVAQQSIGGPISESAMKVVLSVREAVEAFIQFGMEKNHDDRLQDLLFLSSQSYRDEAPPVRIEADALIEAGATKFEEIRNETSDDFGTLSSSLRSLIAHLFTSSAFRALLSDILVTVREMTAELASSLGAIARQVEVAAHDVEEAALVTNTMDGLKGKARETVQDVQEAGKDARGHQSQSIKEIEQERIKDRVIERLQEVIHHAHKNPDDRASLLNILSLFRKYAESAAILASSTTPTSTEDKPNLMPHIKATPRFSKELDDVKVLLERSASGRSLDPLLRTLATTTSDILHADEGDAVLHDYFHHLSSFLHMALVKPTYVSSPLFINDANRLYDTGRELLDSEKHTVWARDVRALIAECTSFTSSLESDSATQRLIASIQVLRDSLAIFSVDAVAGLGRSKRRIAEEARRDLLGWMLPKLLRRVNRLPMPRIELIMGKLECAVDALFLNTTPKDNTGYGAVEETIGMGLMPDRMWMQSWNEMKVEMVPEDEDYHHQEENHRHSRGVQSSARIKLHLDGVRLSASDIGYYVKYNDILIPGVSYSDEGLLSFTSGQGITVDLDIEVGQASYSSVITQILPEFLGGASSSPTIGDGSIEPLFRILDVGIRIPGLAFSIDQSKHYLLNKLFLQHVSGPVVRRMAGNILSDQLRAALEKLALVGGYIVREAEKEKVDRRMSERKEYEIIQEEEDEDTSPNWGDWRKAFFAKIPLLFSSQEDQQQQQREEEVHTESHTGATMKGIVYSSVTKPAEDNQDAAEGGDNAAAAEETVVAIGAGAQLFPNKGGPYGAEPDNSLVDTAKGLQDDARGILSDGLDGIRKGADAAGETLQDGVERAVEMRRDIDAASRRKKVRFSREVKEEGWRSTVFDFADF